ncbi:unnamed protein product [Trifolium pratense]|uniref:Uncharacterized protein n=1 Tax=Trifolium pratense TaxID=57577 RepID=A0ACB0LAU3_TRIPR|nr:unnamed protein product [Trifolium pratense]
MTKNLKLALAIILFVCLFSITQETKSAHPIATSPFIPLIKCTTTQDCPHVVFLPHVLIAACIDGHCHQLNSITPNIYRKD